MNTRKVMLGNAAIAYGAVEAGVKVVSGYPGTPSTEVIETVAAIKKGGKYADFDAFHAEWTTNEKAAVEVAAGAAYSGVRSMAVMKQVGLNVASDPLMSLAYVGVKGGMVLVVADDPGPISSQTEQDTRHFGKFSNVPVLDPSSPEEAYEMTKYAFTLSEKLGMPVILRTTTKVSHASGTVTLSGKRPNLSTEGFVKDPRWVIFPPLSYRRHIEMEQMEKDLSVSFCDSPFNSYTGTGKVGIVTGGVTTAITKDVLNRLNADVRLLTVGTPYPAPEGLYEKILGDTDSILVLEELDPVLEESLYYVKGKKQLATAVFGKKDGFVPVAGELRDEQIETLLRTFLELPEKEPTFTTAAPSLPVRPPVLCAGCPHRASFLAVKTAMKGRDAVYCGDIGCYTLGNAAPLNTTDTCLCMGAGLTVAQGIKRACPEKTLFSFIGDSTFFASGLTGLAAAVFNKSNINIVVLDNSTTAMTGQQPHPGIGFDLMGDASPKIDIAETARALKAGFVETVNPFDFEKAVDTARRAADYDGVSVIIFKAPCIAISKSKKALVIENCIGCMRCVRELGCPAIYLEDGKAKIDASLCTGCGLCTNFCAKNCIKTIPEGGENA